LSFQAQEDVKDGKINLVFVCCQTQLSGHSLRMCMHTKRLTLKFCT